MPTGNMPTKNKMQEIVESALREAEREMRDGFGKGTVRKAYALLAHGFNHGGRDQVVGSEPLVYTRNIGGTRAARIVGSYIDTIGRKRQRPYAERTQHDMCLRQCYAIANTIRTQGPSEPPPEPPVAMPEPETPPEPETEPEITAEPTPSAARDFIRKIWQAREMIRQENAGSVKGGTIPEVGTRAILDGAKAHLAGIPFEATLASIALDWTPNIRTRLGVNDFDWSALPMPEQGMPEPVEVQRLDVGHHRMFAAALRVCQARNNLALIGPAGCGKTEMAKQLAEWLFPDQPEMFSMLPMSGGITRGDLCGTETMSGFKTRPFPSRYADGGVFLADEMDRSNPKVLPVLNSALANATWKNPMTDGEPLKRHPDFVFIAAMNTMGIGADRTYTAAERLDGATRDRIAASRIEMDYDKDLEQRIFDAILASK